MKMACLLVSSKRWLISRELADFQYSNRYLYWNEEC